MKTMTITIARTPRTLQFDGATIDVEELSVRLPFARKPIDITDMCASGDYVVYVTETRTMTPEEFDSFSHNFFTSRDWLQGKGGYAGQGRLCVEIHAPGRPYLYVDPSGSDYGRFVGRLG
ncbi:MAG: hypothetical protein WBI20_02845 [Burkholderiaceae bacterium]